MARQKNNPFQILIVAALFFLPSLFLLFHHGSAAVAHYGNRNGTSAGIEIEPQGTVHAYGVGLSLISLAITAFYFHLRRQIRLDEQFPHRRKRRHPTDLFE